MNKKRGFTLIELLASIAILAVVLLLVSVSYSGIRRNVLESQYKNVKSVIEEAAVKYASNSGYYNFYVQELVDESLVESDDERGNVYDPRDKEPLNCNLVTIREDKHGNLIATLHDEKGELADGHTCNNDESSSYTSDLLLTKKLHGTNISYDSSNNAMQAKEGSIYPYIYNGWTKEPVDITTNISGIDKDKTGSYYIWNKNLDNRTEYNGTNSVTYTTNEYQIYDANYYVDYYLADGSSYQSRFRYRFDNEKPTIYHERTRLASGESNDEWSKSKTVILYATDKEGVGLDRIYVGTRPCTDLLTDRNMGQAALPGMVQTYKFTDEAGVDGIYANVCAIDKLGNLSGEGGLVIKKVDNTKPRVNVTAYKYVSGQPNDAGEAYGGLGTKTYTNDGTYYLPDWNNHGATFKFDIDDDGCGIASSQWFWDEEYKYTEPSTFGGVGTISNVAGTRYASLSADGWRKGKMVITDKLGNTTTIIVSVKVDTLGPTAASGQTKKGGSSGTVITNTNGWYNDTLWFGNYTATESGSGIDHYEYSNNCKDLSGNLNPSGHTYNTYGYVYCIRGVDKAGNAGPWSGKYYFNVDKDKPVIKVSAYNGSTTYNAQTTYNSDATLRVNNDNWTNGAYFEIRASDGTSNLKKVSWRWDEEYKSSGYATTTNGGSEGNIALSNASLFTESLTGTGQRKALIIAEDNAGNKTTVTVYAKVDTTAPTSPAGQTKKGGSSGTVITNSNTWYSDTLWFGNYSSTETGSGIDHYEYSNANCTEKAGNLTTSGYTYDKTLSYVYCIRGVDKVGNVGAWSGKYYFNVDKDKPSAPTMNFVYGDWSTYNSSNWATRDVYAARASGAPSPVSSDGSGSGIDRYEIYDSANSKWVTYAYNSSSSLYKMSTDGNHSRKFRAVDKAGNISAETTVTAKIDKTPPTVTITTYDYSSTATNNVGALYLGNRSYSGSGVHDVGAIAGNTGSTNFKTFKVDASDATSGVDNYVEWYRDIKYSTTGWPSSLDRMDTGTVPYYNNFNVAGYREARAEISDLAGNKTTVVVRAKINVSGGSGGGSSSGGSTCSVPSNPQIVSCSSSAQVACPSSGKRGTLSNYGANRNFGCKSETQIDTIREFAGVTAFTIGNTCQMTSSGAYSVTNKPRVVVNTHTSIKRGNNNLYYDRYPTTEKTCGTSTYYETSSSSSSLGYRVDAQGRVFECTAYRDGNDYAADTLSGDTYKCFCCQ